MESTEFNPKYIPIYQELIQIVRKIDGFNVFCKNHLFIGRGTRKIEESVTKHCQA